VPRDEGNGGKARGDAGPQAKAWSLRQRGWAQDRIAESLGVHQSQISRWLDVTNRRELARLSKHVERQKVTQTAWLEHIFDEALQAWERSKQPRARVTRRQGEAPEILGKDGKVIGRGKSPEQTATQHEQRDGDPVHLQTAMQAARELRRLWGLDAPKEEKGGGGPSFADVLARMKASAARYDAKGKGDDHG